MDLTKVTRDWNHADSFLDNKYNDTKKYVDNQINPEFVYDETAVSCKTVPQDVGDFTIVSTIYGGTHKTVNLIPYPYYSSSDTEAVNGIKRTINVDGTITFNGTSTANTTNFFCANPMSLKAGTYTISGCPNLDGCQLRIKVDSTTYDVNANETKTIVVSADSNNVQVYPRVTKSGVVCNNTVFKPMIQEGTEATAYEPYGQLWNSPIESVVSYSKNRWDGTYVRYYPDESGKWSAASGSNTYSAVIDISGLEHVYIGRIPRTDGSYGNRFRISTYSSYPEINDVGIRYYNDNTVTSYDFERDSNEKYMAIFVITSSSTISEIPKVYTGAVEYDGNLTAYNKITISVPDSIKNLEGYGLGISDTVRNYVDFETGKYYRNCGSVDLGSLTWVTQTNAGITRGKAAFTDAKQITSTIRGNLICSDYDTISADETLKGTANGIAMPISVSTGQNFYLYPYKTTEELDGVIAVYELATPEIIDISDIIRPIKCEQGGTITLVNEHNLDVQNSIIYEREVSEHD